MAASSRAVRVVESTVTVSVTPQVKGLFEGLNVKGDGGFQSLIRNLMKRLESGERVLHFSPDEFRRICTYATSYGDGTYQTRLRLLITLWVSQHLDELITCAK